MPQQPTTQSMLTLTHLREREREEDHFISCHSFNCTWRSWRKLRYCDNLTHKSKATITNGKRLHTLILPFPNQMTHLKLSKLKKLSSTIIDKIILSRRDQRTISQATETEKLYNP